MSNLFGVPLLLGFVAFLIGWLAAKFSAYVGKRAADLEAPEQHSTIRQLEATLRIARKDAESATGKLAASTQELETLRVSFDDLEQTQQICEEELECLRQAVKSESTKVVELRRTLTDHAEETIRAVVSARESATELSVLKAGGTFASDELSSMFDDDGLDAGCEELNDHLLAAVEEATSEPTKNDSVSRGPAAEPYMSDC